MPPLDINTGLAAPRACAEDDSDELGGQLTGLFGLNSPELIKEKVRAAKRPEAQAYNVHDRYHERGCFQWIGKHPVFENFTLGVIVVNAVWLSIDTDRNKSNSLLDADLIFIVVDSMFFSYFVVELFIRFMAFRNKCHCFCDAWFIFDSLLVALYAFDPFGVALMVWQSGGGQMNLPTSILRLFRLARLSRLVRMLRSLPELMIMIKGIVQATASVGYTLGLLMVITYVFGIALTQLSADKEFGEEFFRTVPLAMYSLIIYGTFLDDLAHFCDRIKAESTPCLVLVTLFVILASMTVMNMLVGVLCEVISETAEYETESMMTDKVYERFDAIVKELDQNNDGKISWKEFQQIMEYEVAINALESVGVDPVGWIDFTEDYFFDEHGDAKTLTFDNFMGMVLDLRGGQKAKIRDVMSIGRTMNTKFADIKEKIYKIEGMLNDYARQAGKAGIMTARSRKTNCSNMVSPFSSCNLRGSNMFGEVSLRKSKSFASTGCTTSSESSTPKQDKVYKSM